MEYRKLVDLYEKLESTTKRLEKTYYTSNFIKNCPEELLDIISLLLQGKIFPDWNTDKKIGVADKIVVSALNICLGISISEIEKEWKKTGDIGDATIEIIRKKRQSTLFQKTLTIKKVYSNLKKLADTEGIGSTNNKIQIIAELLTSASPLEGKYIVRTVLEDMRVGIAQGIIRDSIVWAFFPKVNFLFEKCLMCNEIVPNQDLCINCKSELKNKLSDKTIKIENIRDIEDIKLKDFELIECPTEEIAREVYNLFVEKVKYALDVTNDFGKIILTIKNQGPEGLEDIKLSPGTPIKVMLAQKIKTMEESFEKLGSPLAAEYKLDGFRMQIHKFDNKITIYTRRLENVTDQFPDVVEFVRKNIIGVNFIIDSECVGYDVNSKEYLPFQKISQRIRRKYDIIKIQNEFPVELNVFDVIYLNNETLLNKPYEERRKLVKAMVEEEQFKIVVVKNKITDNIEELRKFYEEALAKKMEGIMIKSLNAGYKPGSRVGFMVKYKPIMETLDLVITGAEWGEGKRGQWLSSFILSCRDDFGNLYEIGRVGTGFKEKSELGLSFEELTEMLKPLIISEDSKIVKVKPQIILEISFEEIQKSPTYSSGFALRFPRIVRLRDDRRIEDSSNLELIEQMYFEQ